jgi:hypothetical protein
MRSLINTIKHLDNPTPPKKKSDAIQSIESDAKSIHFIFSWKN